MAERNNALSVGIIARKSLFCLFVLASTLFIFSWFFVLRSTGRPRSIIDHSLLPNSKFPNLIENWNSAIYGQNGVEPTPFVAPVEHEERRSPARAQPGEILKIFMYDLSPEFHFGLLDWEAQGGSVWPDLRAKVPEYPGGLNLQHSIEYWLTLDILASELPNPPKSRVVARVRNSSEADIVFVPFFSSLSYNRYSKADAGKGKSKNRDLQEKLVRFLTGQREWKASGGRDHLIVAHHPNSMLEARMKLWPATFILSDFGRYPPNIANVDKDVIAPYKHVIRTFENDSSGFESRPTLLYFQGAIYRKDGGYVRQELFYLLKEETDVHFAFGSVQKDGIHKATQGMQSSKFCLNIAGDTPSSNRLFDAIASHCVPVIISDDIELPYEDVLDYTEFCIFVRTSDALKENFLVNLVRSIGKDEWTRMWNALKRIERFFEFQYPSVEDDAVQMIWRAVARKVPAMRMKVHRSRRFSRSLGSSKREFRTISVPSPRNFW